MIALSCLAVILLPAVGAIVLANALFWRLCARRVTGTVVAVDEVADSDGERSYAATYQYADVAGLPRRATSTLLSGSLQGLSAGCPRRLLVFPERPGAVREEGVYFLEVFGILFVVGGLWIVHDLQPAWSVTGLLAATLGLSAGALWRSVHKRRAVLASRPTAPSTAIGGPASPAAVNADLRAAPQATSLDPQEVARRLAQERSGGWMALVMGLLFLGAGLYPGWRIVQLEIAGRRADGTVVRNLEESSDDKSVYRPEVRFTSQSGTVHQFVDWDGSSHPAYRVDEHVGVLYLARSPQDSAVIDKGLSNWTMTLIFGGLGGAMVVSFWRRKTARPPSDPPASA